MRHPWAKTPIGKSVEYVSANWDIAICFLFFTFFKHIFADKIVNAIFSASICLTFISKGNSRTALWVDCFHVLYAKLIVFIYLDCPFTLSTCVLYIVLAPQERFTSLSWPSCVNTKFELNCITFVVRAKFRMYCRRKICLPRGCANLLQQHPF